MRNYLNAQYVGHIYLGGKEEDDSPVEKIKVIFDTGSSWVWVLSTDCAIKLPGDEDDPYTQQEECMSTSEKYNETLSAYNK